MIKKLTVAILFTAISTYAFAGWVLIDVNDEFLTYVDTATIKKKGNKVVMWQLDDFVKPQTESRFNELSKKSKFVYDCKNESRIISSAALYEGNMGNGKVLFVHDWEKGEATESAIVPSSIGEKLLKAACSKK